MPTCSYAHITKQEQAEWLRPAAPQMQRAPSRLIVPSSVTSVTTQKGIAVVVRLTEWNDNEPYDRLAIDDKSYDIRAASIPERSVPVRCCRDLGIVRARVARSHRLRHDSRGDSH